MSKLNNPFQRVEWQTHYITVHSDSTSRRQDRRSYSAAVQALASPSNVRFNVTRSFRLTVHIRTLKQSAQSQPWSFTLMISFLSPFCLPSLPPSTTSRSIW